MLDLAITWLPIIGGIIVSVGITAWYTAGASKSVAIWSGFVGGVMMAAGLCLHLQKLAWQEDGDKDKLTAAQIAQQRAYVHIVDGFVKHLPGEPPTVSLIIRNTGQTPAVELTWRSVFGYALIANIKEVKLDNSAAPVYTLARDHTLTVEYKYPQWNQANDTGLELGVATLVAVSEIRYKDVFGNSWAADDRLISGGRFPINDRGVMPGRWAKAPE